MRQLPPLGKHLLLDLAAAVAQRDKKVMPLLWDPDRGWLTWLCQSLIKRVLLWCVLQPASATTDRTPSPGICQAHGDKSCCSWARGEEWKPSKRDSTYAVGNPKTCSQPSRPPSCCRWVPHHSLQHRGRNFSVKNTGLAVPWPPETRGGEGLRVRTGPMELRRHRALEEEPSWASVCMAKSGDKAAGLCMAPQKPRQEGIPARGRLVMCWLCAGGTRSSLVHVCQQGPTGDSQPHVKHYPT